MGQGGIIELLCWSKGVVSFPWVKNRLCSSKCQEELELLFSFEGCTTFEISDTRTFIFINSTDSLLLSLNTGLSI